MRSAGHSGRLRRERSSRGAAPLGDRLGGQTTFARTFAHYGAKVVSVDELIYTEHGAYGVDYPEPMYPAFEREP